MPENLPQPGAELSKSLEIGKPDVSIRALNPENPEHLEIARTLDLMALDAYNPLTREVDPELAHEAQTDVQLRRWMTDRFEEGKDQGMMRVIEIPDPANGPDAKKAVGFVYVYNDSRTDSDFQRRAQLLRKNKGEGLNHSVWEANFSVYEGTPDVVVEAGVKATLEEFATTRTRETTTVMFIEEEDLKEAVMGARSELGEMAKGIKKEDTLQDTRILGDLGFRYSGSMQYAQGDVANRAYTMAIGPKTSF